MERVRALRKKDHIQSVYFCNNYLPRNIISFKGIAETRNITSPIAQEVLLVQQTPWQPVSSSHLKGSNVSLNQILSSKVSLRSEDRESSIYMSSISTPGE
jgi:hypothetical protein